MLSSIQYGCYHKITIPFYTSFHYNLGSLSMCMCLNYKTRDSYRIFVEGRGHKHQPVVLSQMLLCVVEMCSFFIKCINEKTKRLSSERMMLYITKSWQHAKILGGETQGRRGIFQVSHHCMNPWKWFQKTNVQ